MSYDQTVDNKVVYFREEEDYLDCRMQYLKYCRDAVMPEATFIQYIQNGMYPIRITVENIVSVIDNYVPTTNSFAVGNDSGNIHSGSMVTGQFATGQDVHISGNLIVDGTIDVSGDSNFATGGITDVGTTIGSYGQADLTGDVYTGVPYSEPYNETESDGMSSSEIDETFGAVPQEAVSGGLPIPSSLSEESISEKPPVDPIENRWEILDLRGDDNADD